MWHYNSIEVTSKPLGGYVIIPHVPQYVGGHTYVYNNKNSTTCDLVKYILPCYSTLAHHTAGSYPYALQELLSRLSGQEEVGQI